MAGRIYCGDNLEVLSLSEFFQPEMVDLVYADPPFNSQRTYNIVYKDSNAQDEAFKDFWTWTEAAPMYARLMSDSTLLPRSLKPLLESLHARLIDDDDDLLAYLTMMTPRLVAMHRVLKKTGSLYLHCDPTASHYLKVVLDAIFGKDGFKNEIVWRRFGAKNDPKRYGRCHDVLLFYTKSDDFCWNEQRMPVEEYSIKKNFTAEDDGRLYTLVDLTAHKAGGDVSYEWHGVRPYKGRYWAYSKENMDRMFDEGLIVFRRTGMPRLKRYLDEQPGVPLQDVWLDIKLATASKERLGYPTQKPLELISRILKASTNHGDIVLDPFCGCGTTVEASERLGRRWFGVDIAKKAVDVISARFARAGLDAPEIVWQPADKDAAHALGEAHKSGFEKWALRKIRAARVRAKDRGIDGEALFKDNDTSYHVIVSVKAGGVKPGDVRDLRGTMDREHSPIGVFVTRNPPSEEMKREAVRLGFLDSFDAEGPIPRIQFVSVERMFGPLPPIRCPGKNVTEMPKPTIPPPPVIGEQLGLDIDPKVRDRESKPSTARARVRKPGPAKTYEMPEVGVRAVAETIPPPAAPHGQLRMSKRSDDFRFAHSKRRARKK